MVGDITVYATADLSTRTRNRKEVKAERDAKIAAPRVADARRKRAPEGENRKRKSDIQAEYKARSAKLRQLTELAKEALV